LRLRARGHFVDVNVASSDATERIRMQLGPALLVSVAVLQPGGVLFHRLEVDRV